MKYLKFILEQLPDNSHVTEIGCGSGLLFSSLRNKEKLFYTGIDISENAIAAASKLNKDYKNARWLVSSVEQLNQEQLKMHSYCLMSQLYPLLNMFQVKPMPFLFQ